MRIRGRVCVHVGACGHVHMQVCLRVRFKIKDGINRPVSRSIHIALC